MSEFKFLNELLIVESQVDDSGGFAGELQRELLTLRDRDLAQN